MVRYGYEGITTLGHVPVRSLYLPPAAPVKRSCTLTGPYLTCGISNVCNRCKNRAKAASAAPPGPGAPGGKQIVRQKTLLAPLSLVSSLETFDVLSPVALDSLYCLLIG